MKLSVEKDKCNAMLGYKNLSRLAQRSQTRASVAQRQSTLITMHRITFGIGKGECTQYCKMRLTSLCHANPLRKTIRLKKG